ncbi:hypothetical protein [Mycobacterium asiaticum]|uniref:VWFA domain-containing protein n=1 Tax=Mycobacterium asiaticum TaxID=1790 RepID=A0A1A3KKC5_MYCAS|nr:hypothetical protein [Mycobacterium asiaticum]OBJ52269.1 hypothetical protein A9W94_25095 [Mycobacterium asiaticum]OBJ84894.1 hypothetical protein A5640_14655 [Mycobacterium asiaticum]
MELKWWPVFYIGLLSLAVAVAAAALLPTARLRRTLRPLAHVDRLTRLPQYLRVYRFYLFSVVVTGVLLLATFLTALTASARPTGMASARLAFDTAHPRDIMLCVGAPVTDAATADFLSYYASYAQRLPPEDTRRVGLTSPTLRVIPLTRDHRYLTDRLGSLSRLARIQQALNERKALPDNDREELTRGIEGFSRPVGYVDYAPSVPDTLAQCMAGFPSYPAERAHRRQLIYFGYSTFRDPAERRPSLFSGDTLKRLAVQQGVQVNVVARSDVATSSTEDADTLQDTAQECGGRFFQYNPAGAASADTLNDHLDEIDDNGPTAQLPGGKVISVHSADSPEALLIGGLLAAALLSVSLAVLRR